ncbi:MAG TPA: prepilin-type N-terminal cleavage/methylation domain-containing protein [Caldimonas sp.]|jgi:general secretion pathway protein J|nr:prepilin-type N-terminal cleavage/methylation domain-containing protein [Caldimonas sp.]
MQGFTLIEVLVAMVVMAIMSLLAWQGVDGIARTRESNQVRLEQILRLETVIAQWEQDLAALQETTAVPALRCDGQSVRLTRRAEGGMQVVLWTLRPDAGGNVWQRWAGPATVTTHGLQESWLRSQQFQGGEDGLLRALDGVESWQVYFYRGNAWANCQSSGDIAPATPVSPVTPLTPMSASAPASGVAPAAATPTVLLPSGVRVVLVFAPGSGLNGNLVRDVLLAP